MRYRTRCKSPEFSTRQLVLDFDAPRRRRRTGQNRATDRAERYQRLIDTMREMGGNWLSVTEAAAAAGMSVIAASCALANLYNGRAHGVERMYVRKKRNGRRRPLYRLPAYSSAQLPSWLYPAMPDYSGAQITIRTIKAYDD